MEEENHRRGQEALEELHRAFQLMGESFELQQRQLEVLLSNPGMDDAGLRARFRELNVPWYDETTDYGDISQMFDEERPLGVEHDKAAVKSLSSKIMSSADCLETCSICLEEYEDGQEALEMACLHVFHGHCIQKWMEKRTSCPLCRFNE